MRGVLDPIAKRPVLSRSSGAIVKEICPSLDEDNFGQQVDKERLLSGAR